MTLSLIYLFVVSCVAQRTTTPRTGTARERIQLTNYQIYTDQYLNLTYDAYPGAYDFDLYLVNG